MKTTPLVQLGMLSQALPPLPPVEGQAQPRDAAALHQDIAVQKQEKLQTLATLENQRVSVSLMSELLRVQATGLQSNG